MKIHMESDNGKVYITGAGPGDKGLITLKAISVLQLADVVVYDYLVNKELLLWCKADCEKIYVGKKAGSHSASQDEINKILYKFAVQKKLVVRLKGGDPFVFGRGGEEALFLAEKKIVFEIIPGVTSGVAVPAYSGIPVTHRGLSSTVTFISGHDACGSEDLNLNWNALATLRGTLVFYMGVQNLESICNNLIKNGMDPSAPIAITRYGTYNFQESVFGNLSNIVYLSKESGIKPPAIILVGDVVDLHNKIDWFSAKPLFGKKILVTRSQGQASSLSTLLKEKGADVIEFPAIKIQALKDYSKQKDVISKLSDFHWLIFTSANTVLYFFSLLHEKGLDSRALASCKIASIGKETGKKLMGHGLVPDLMPKNYTAEALIDTFKTVEINGCNVLIPSSDIAREIISVDLSGLGANVLRMPVYENVMPEYKFEDLESIFSEPFDCITFTSSSTVQNLFRIIDVFPQFKKAVASSKMASIGPVTSQSILNLGFEVEIEAKEHTIEGLVKAVESFLSRK